MTGVWKEKGKSLSAHLVPVRPDPRRSEEDDYRRQLQAWKSSLTAGASFEGQAQWLEDAARAVLSEAGHDPDNPALTHLPARDLEAGSSDRDDTGKAVDHADRVLHLLRYARHAVANGKPDEAARWALEAGMAAATMFAVHRIGDGARAARAAKQKAAAATDHALWREEGLRLRARFPTESIPRIAGRVVKNLALDKHPETVAKVLRRK